tara:strand:- start:558 stop:1616 length:1059 start_codon:yes stop_codon:yes gene_type:complete
MSEINLNYYQYNELEKICWKSFHPVDRFMSSVDLSSVVNDFHLKNGKFFPLPIFLDIDEDTKNKIGTKSSADLIFQDKKVGVINIDDIYKIKKLNLCKKIFGTNSRKHPGVNFFLNTKEWFVGGTVSQKGQQIFDNEINELKPEQTKKYFRNMKWKTIVGFQTRNIPHRAHEYLHRVALEFVDGLYINPFIGWKKKGDYTPKAIFTGYDYYCKKFINSKRVCLNLSRMNMRYAGPRESLFHAIIRRNYGCTHFIIGRDHAGVGNFYKKYEAHELATKFEKELNIKIMKLCGPFYCKICDGIVTEKTCNHTKINTFDISGTYIRNILLKKGKLDNKFIRKEIIKSLEKTKVFI